MVAKYEKKQTKVRSKKTCRSGSSFEKENVNSLYQSLWYIYEIYERRHVIVQSGINVKHRILLKLTRAY
jgi:hypothetical protein